MKTGLEISHRTKTLFHSTKNPCILFSIFVSSPIQMKTHENRNSPNHQQNHQQHQQQKNHQSSPNYHSNNHNGQRKSHHQNGRQQQKSPSSASYFNTTVGSVSPFKYVKNGNGYIVGRQSPPSATASSSPSIPIANGSSRMSPGGHSSSSTPVCFASPAGVSSSPPNLHFASSKCFDAPSPDSLPRPPQHWTNQRANGIGHSVSVANIATATATATSQILQNGFGATPRNAETSSNHTKSSSGKSSSSKRRLFNNDNATKASQQNGGRGGAANIIRAGGCMPTSTTASDIFSHNLKLMLNVQA